MGELDPPPDLPEYLQNDDNPTQQYRAKTEAEGFHQGNWAWRRLEHYFDEDGIEGSHVPEMDYWRDLLRWLQEFGLPQEVLEAVCLMPTDYPHGSFGPTKYQAYLLYYGRQLIPRQHLLSDDVFNIITIADQNGDVHALHVTYLIALEVYQNIMYRLPSYVASNQRKLDLSRQLLTRKLECMRRMDIADGCLGNSEEWDQRYKYENQ